MPTIPMRLVATVERRAEACPVLHSPGDGALVSRGHDRLLILRCPCGCGDDVVINLDLAAGPAWSMYRTNRGTSVFPSVWRETGCGSHFIIWDDRILLFGGGSRAWDIEGPDHEFDRRVLQRLRVTGAIAFKRLAEQMGEVPWNVLSSCRHLVNTGLVDEVEDATFDLRQPPATTA